MNAPQNWLLMRNCSRRTPLLFLAASGAIFLSVFLAGFFLESGLSWRCPSILLFDLPCPSCGTTRALAALSEFHLLEALRLNPLIVISLGLFLFAPPIKFSFEKFERQRGWFLFGTVVCLNWLYLVFFLPR